MYGVLEMFRKGGERKKKKRVLLWFSIRKTLNKRILVSRLFTLCYFDSYTLVSLPLGADIRKRCTILVLSQGERDRSMDASEAG